MSDYHILEQAVDLKTVNVVFHYQVTGAAGAKNSAGIQWQDAARMHLFKKDDAGNSVPIFSVLPGYHVNNFPGGIETAEETAIGVGAVIEKPETVRFSSINLTPAQRLAEVEVAHTAWAAALEAELMIELDWIGHRGDVP
jgi:hypothetical protein